MRKINPIIKGFSPDPSICKSDGFYYLVTSSFEYFPGIAIYKSQNLEDWELINYAIKESKGNFNYETIDDSLGIFAPTIRKYKDKFYIFCTFVDPREDVVDQNFYVYTTDPEQEWSNPVLLDFEGIDPSPFFTERGCYVQFSAKDETGRSCIKQALISLDGKHNILKEEIISYGSGGRDVEAPHIFLKDDYYYLLTAEGGTREGHMVTISRSRDIWGPYDSYIENPILTHRDDAKHPVQNVGHADIIKDYKGNYHMVCLGTRPVNFKHNLGREVFKTTFIWEKNQWPKINKTLSIKPLKSQKITENWEKNYSYSKQWRSIRKSINRLIKFDKGLILNGNQNSMVDNKTPAYLCRFQESYNFKFDIIIDLKNSNGKFGILLENGSDIHSEFLIRKKNTNFLIENNLYIYGMKDSQKIRIEPDSKNVHLILKGDTKYYYFIYKDNKKTREISRIKRELFSTEVSSSPFTGVTFGLYVHGKNSKGVYKKYTLELD